MKSPVFFPILCVEINSKDGYSNKNVIGGWLAMRLLFSFTASAELRKSTVKIIYARNHTPLTFFFVHLN